MIDPTTQQEPREHRRLRRKDPGVAPRRSVRRRSLLAGLVLAVLATTLASVATSGAPAGALSCGDVGSCDVLTVQLTARIAALNGPATNVLGYSALNRAAADAENARGNTFAAYHYEKAAYFFGVVVGDANANGSKDLDEASLYLLFYRNAADRNSAQARGWLDTAEQLVNRQEWYRLYAIDWNAAATIISNLWANNLASPVGTVDAVTPLYNPVSGRFDQLQVSGWAIDPDTAQPITVGITPRPEGAIGPFVGVTVTANTSRPDVGAAYSPYGAYHGYTVTIPWTGGNVTVCATGNNVGPGNGRQFACRTAAVRTDWTRTNLDLLLYGQSIHGHVPNYVRLATTNNQKAVACVNLPNAQFRPTNSIPLGKHNFYDCRRVGTVDRQAAQAALGSAGAGQFKADTGEGPDWANTVYRADVISGVNGGFSDPDIMDAVEPRLPTRYIGAWGAIDLARTYSSIEYKSWRATRFRQYYGVEANGTVWAWKVATVPVCQIWKFKAVGGVPFEWTSKATTC